MRSGKRVIAAIGIDRYPVAGVPALDNAVNDARGVVEMFAKLGFEPVTPPLYDADATYDEMRALVMADGPLRSLTPDDDLVVFYAGHGTTRVDDLGSEQVKTGYLLPHDADRRTATWLELDPWLQSIARLRARHILVIIDACQSGIALSPVIKWRDVETWKTEPLASLEARKSRRIITSALDDQRAMDGGPMSGHSLFTGCLIETLKFGVGDPTRVRITGSELGQYLRNRVVTYPGTQQTPDYGTFAFDNRGEMLLPILEPGSKRPADPPRVASPPAWHQRVLVATTALAGATIIALVAYWLGKPDPTPDKVEDAAVELVTIDAPAAAPPPPVDAALDLVDIVAARQPFKPGRGVQLQSQILRGTYRQYLQALPASARATAVPALGWDDGRDDEPVGAVTFSQAQAFCAAIHARLPTQAEWYAAGPTKQLPWEWSATESGGTAWVVGGQKNTFNWRSKKTTDQEIAFRCVR